MTARRPTTARVTRTRNQTSGGDAFQCSDMYERDCRSCTASALTARRSLFDCLNQMFEAADRENIAC
jgi:hypothetical protein